MDAVASPGTSTDPSRGDHVHPRDTSKQDTPVSRTNLKTVNGQSLLGSSDLAVSGAGLNPSSATPLMDGTAAVGTSTDYARGDHRHPSDTSRQATLVSGTNIKTVNGQTLLGTGDVAISGGPSPSDANPAMDGRAAPGTATTYSRSDHVHPKDTSKQDTLVSGTHLEGNAHKTENRVR